MNILKNFPDPHFFPKPLGPFTLDELARLVRAEIVKGNGQAKISNILPLELAGNGHLSFFFRPKPAYLKALANTHASAVIVAKTQMDKVPDGKAVLLSENPHLSMTLAMRVFYPEEHLNAYLGLDQGITQAIHPSAKISKDAIIEHGAVIGAGVEIGSKVRIGPNTVIYPHVKIADNTRIGAGCVLSYCYVGSHVVIGHSVTIGNAGFGFAFDPSITDYIDIPHLGVVHIADKVHIKDNVSIARGSHHDTVIEQSVRLDNLVHVAHNVHIGALTVVAGQVGFAGSTRIGKGVQLGGQAGVSGHLTIGDKVTIGAQSGVVSDVPDGVTVMGTPAMLQSDYHRMVKANRAVLRKGRTPQNS